MTNAGQGDDTVLGQLGWLQVTLSSIGDGVIGADARVASTTSTPSPRR